MLDGILLSTGGRLLRFPPSAGSASLNEVYLTVGDWIGGSILDVDMGLE